MLVSLEVSEALLNVMLPPLKPSVTPLHVMVPPPNVLTAPICDSNAGQSAPGSVGGAPYSVGGAPNSIGGAPQSDDVTLKQTVAPFEVSEFLNIIPIAAH